MTEYPELRVSKTNPNQIKDARIGFDRMICQYTPLAGLVEVLSYTHIRDTRCIGRLLKIMRGENEQIKTLNRLSG